MKSIEIQICEKGAYWLIGKIRIKMLKPAFPMQKSRSHHHYADILPQC